MLSSFIKVFLLVHNVCATCTGGAKNDKACKASSTSEELALLQNFASKVSPPRTRDQPKLNEAASFETQARERARQAATRRLEEFKAEALEAFGVDQDLVKYFGSRDDAFYSRFLMFNEIYEKGEHPEKALTMLVNYATLINKYRKKGFLNGLGAEVIRPYMKTETYRVLTTRDKSGRRIALGLARDTLNKVSDESRTRLFLYWLIKFLCFDDTMDRGLIFLGDLTGVSLSTVMGQLRTKTNSSALFVDDTFPMITSKILLYNSPSWAYWSWKMVSVFIPKSVSQNIELVKDISLESEQDKVEEFVDRSAFPTDSPFNGELVEGWDAALEPGLGPFYEPEMDPAEKKVILTTTW